MQPPYAGSLPNGFSSAPNYSATKHKAIEDARAAQAVVVRECAEAGREVPPYKLLELIGKGSFGRVYKAVGTKTSQLVAVKVISIEEGDGIQPGAADTLGDILKEVNTLKLLSNSGARNVNAVVDTHLVGQAVWVVTEYCAGGSVASLMRPTSGLAERWIIPILREVAEALFWVHKQGIIHRDIKCANVLVTEAGGVQLCDFGVAGIMETKFDKRSTITGTLHWMAPELFDPHVAYGIEVDIWAFGSMAYEIANGLPPNATARINIQQFGAYLKQHRPRLQGDRFSDNLKNLIAFCLVEDPKRRPPIEDVQRHPYIFNTHDRYPTVSLARLVADYKHWESQGGSRQSLFSAGGAQGPRRDRSPVRQSGWDFGNFDEVDELMFQNTAKPRPAPEYYPSVASSPENTARPMQRRRRRPPPTMKELKAPLEKVFDPYTITNYGDASRAWYGRIPMPPPTSAPAPSQKKPEPKPMAKTESPAPARESLIDLDLAFDSDTGPRMASSLDEETIKPATRPISIDLSGSKWSFSTVEKRSTQEWSFPTAKRDTQEWTFPAMTPVTAAFAPLSDTYNSDNEDFSGDTHLRPPHSYDDTGAPTNRDSAMSLIDLDASLADDGGYSAPSSFAPSSHIRSSDSVHGSLSFDLELDADADMNTREPSLYIDDDMESVPSLTRQLSDLQSTPTTPDERPNNQWGEPSGLGIMTSARNSSIMTSLPPLPNAPSPNVLQGLGTQEDLKNELHLMISSMREHLQYANDWLKTFDTPSHEDDEQHQHGEHIGEGEELREQEQETA
ncbi:serine/threonine protein kinase, STE family, PAK/STE20-related [Trichoderma citrinoviride]|uniref:non-specific serine/threonine protein kinase n=1 Tax=Trichoderma citrinoviride TaxID=58853 RepID=A0A2T4BAJ3_9HYPO|nr:serine/threonine protein kinase, STE family, PAK/STE20-related [Trichoderma citrinoviride]PTB66352.1 serine/threonine protein kinase, STE family, PAK/STE20-related [Trichoderma citrinoviride]